MMIRSLRSQILLGIAATTALVFLCSSVTMYVLLRRSLYREYDELLGAKARALATLVEQTSEGIEIGFEEHPMQEFSRQVRPEHYQLWNEQGKVLARSRRLGDVELPRVRGSLNAPYFQSLTLPDGRAGRIVAVTFLPATEGETFEGQEEDDEDDEHDEWELTERPEVTLVVARETAGVDDALAEFTRLIMLVSVVSGLALLALLSWLVTRTLLPLRRLADVIDKVDETELKSPIRLEGAPMELWPIVAQLNQMLRRLDEAFARERTLTADVAHEMRTPLAGLRSTIEVALSRPRGGVEYQETLAECDDICHDMQRVVETLLSLARIDAGQHDVARKSVDLAALIRKSWKCFQHRAEHRMLDITLSGRGHAPLHTDEEKLRIVLSNLFDNAVEYADEGGSIDIAWNVDREGMQITVANTGCELSQAQLAMVTDRFWRADASRAATGTHAGLGLTLCYRMAVQLGGVLDFECDRDRFVARIQFGSASAATDVTLPSPAEREHLSVIGPPERC